MPRSRLTLLAAVCLAWACATLPPPQSPAAFPARPGDTLLAAGPAPSDSASGDFYRGLRYGSESQFNPLTQLLNEGFDMLRMDGSDRRILERTWAYKLGFQNTLRSVTRPDRAYGRYGWGRALRNEVLPLTFSKADGGGAWVPNYTFHLLGSGMVSARLTEWYQQHGAPHPAALSFLTMTASHVLNEALENADPWNHYSVDAATDLLLFDPAGFLLFRSRRVQRFFAGRTLQLSNWPGQPAWALPGNTLENTAQLYVLRGRLPGSARWRFFHAFGEQALLGLSRDLAGGYAVTAAAGADAFRVRVIDDSTGTKTVDLRPVGGIFVDRDGSLLFSVRHMVGGDVNPYGSDAVVAAYLYPGVLRLPGLGSPGMWVQVLRRGGVRVAVVPRLGLGLGVH